MSSSVIKKSFSITGGASDLGHAIAEHFARKGYAICIAGINQERREDTLSALYDPGADTFYVHCDVPNDQDTESLHKAVVERWGGTLGVERWCGLSIIKAIENKTFYVLPHREGRTAWRLKKYLSPIFQRMVNKGYKKVFAKQGYSNIKEAIS